MILSNEQLGEKIILYKKESKQFLLYVHYSILKLQICKELKKENGMY